MEGAGLMNMLFMPRHAHVLCIAMPQHSACHEMFLPVASHLDLELHEFPSPEIIDKRSAIYPIFVLNALPPFAIQ